jgi:hypothetical protein
MPVNVFGETVFLNHNIDPQDYYYQRSSTIESIHTTPQKRKLLLAIHTTKVQQKVITLYCAFHTIGQNHSELQQLYDL